MIQFRTTTPPPFARPYSVIEADARFRRTETMPLDRRARILAAVRRGIAQYEREQDARWACAPEAWTRFLGECDDN